MEISPQIVTPGVTFFSKGGMTVGLPAIFTSVKGVNVTAPL